MRGVGDDDRVARFLAPVGEVRPHEHEAGQLALRAGRRLERDGVEAGDLGEDLLQAPHELERALRAVLLLERVQVAEARAARRRRSFTRGLCFIVQEPSG